MITPQEMQITQSDDAPLLQAVEPSALAEFHYAKPFASGLAAGERFTENEKKWHSRYMRQSSIAWRGVYLLGMSFALMGGWFVVAWIRYGVIPLGLFQPKITFSPNFAHAPVLPPQWVIETSGIIALVALGMMLLGTQRKESGSVSKYD